MITLLRQKGHRNGSGARLAEALGIKHGHPDTKKRTRQDRFIINWGCSQVPNWKQREHTWSNTPYVIATCANKLYTQRALRAGDVARLGWCSDLEPNIAFPAAYWVKRYIEMDGKAIARMTLTGHSGQGIVVLRDPDNIPDAPLYTQYFKKDAEYRVHVFYGKVILLQQKKRQQGYNSAGLTDDQKLIRTNGNGWVFATQNLSCDRIGYRELIEKLALDAAVAVGVSHGAVDILVKHNPTHAVVCEINSAPALKNPSTLNAYVEAFKTHFASSQIR